MLVNEVEDCLEVRVVLRILIRAGLGVDVIDDSVVTEVPAAVRGGKSYSCKPVSGIKKLQAQLHLYIFCNLIQPNVTQI